MKHLLDFCKSKLGLCFILTSFCAILAYAKYGLASAVLLEVIVIGFVVIYKFDKLIRSLRNSDEFINYQSRPVIVEAHNALLLSLKHPDLYMPVSDYTMKPANLMLLESTFLAKKPQLIVELGSGLSTHLLASLVKKEQRGRVVTFDHDYEWVQLTKSYLGHNGLLEFSEVHHVPLIMHEADSIEWYDYKPLQDKIKGIDLLVVDGPPATYDELIRGGALKYLYEFLNDEAVIFIDDADRRGERQIVLEWSKQYPNIKVKRFDTLSGVCLIYIQKKP